jgi:hypothetical protein
LSTGGEKFVVELGHCVGLAASGIAEDPYVTREQSVDADSDQRSLLHGKLTDSQRLIRRVNEAVDSIELAVCQQEALIADQWKLSDTASKLALRNKANQAHRQGPFYAVSRAAVERLGTSSSHVLPIDFRNEPCDAFANFDVASYQPRSLLRCPDRHGFEDTGTTIEKRSGETSRRSRRQSELP